MRIRFAALAVLVCSSVAFAIPPEPSQAKLDEAAARMRAECHTDAKVVLDLESFDTESMASDFSPTLQCFAVVENLANSCKGILDPNARYLGTKVDASLLLELTEVRCTLDQKHEGMIRAWLKEHPRRKRNRTGDQAYAAFVDAAFKDVQATFPTAVLTWPGTRLVAAYTNEVMNVDETVTRAIIAEAKVRANKPGYNARKKALEDKLRGQADKKDDSAWKFLAEGNGGAIREADDRLAAAVKETAEKCDFSIPATIDWASVQAPQDDPDLCRKVGSRCSVNGDIEIFSGQCIGLLTSVADHCKDDKMQALILKKIKSVACKFDRGTNKGKAGTTRDGEFPIELKNGALSAKWAWDSNNHAQRGYQWLKNNL